MENYKVRAALESESTQIKELINLVGINPTGLDWKRFIVAVNDGGQVIACGQIKPHGGDIRELASIAVHPEYQNQGIGTELNLFALQKMKEGGMKIAELGTGGDESHAPARKSYEKAGYTGLPLVRYYKDL